MHPPPNIFLRASTRKAARFTQSMTVPRRSELRPGAGVNIVLKQDQPTGKLTTGHVQDILTRHDHPRGVKVRLTSGQVGRVQSLWKGTGSEQLAVSGVAAQQQEEQRGFEYDIPRREQRRMGRDMDNQLEQSSAAEATSILDYVKQPKSRRKENIAPSKAEEIGTAETQEMLEKEFPVLDSSLIAAILSDHDYDVLKTRTTLVSLSAG